MRGNERRVVVYIAVSRSTDHAQVRAKWIRYVGVTSSLTNCRAYLVGVKESQESPLQRTARLNLIQILLHNYYDSLLIRF